MESVERYERSTGVCFDWVLRLRPYGMCAAEAEPAHPTPPMHAYYELEATSIVLAPGHTQWEANSVRVQ